MSGLINIVGEHPAIIGGINDILGELHRREPGLLPDFSSSESVICVSDYAGEHNAANFQVLSYLFVDFNRCGIFESLITWLRRGRWKDKSNIQFKSLGKDKVRRAVLPDFLQAANTIPGLSITFLIDKDIIELFPLKENRTIHEVFQEEGLGEWKPAVAEKLARIVHIKSLLVAALTREGQKFGWFTDRDAITESDKKLADLGNISQRVLNIYCQHELGFYGYGKSFDDNPEFIISNLLSIPDIVGASVLEYVESFHQNGKDKTKVLLKHDYTNEILMWLADNSKPLKRLVFHIQVEPLAVYLQPAYWIPRLEFHLNEPPRERSKEMQVKAKPHPFAHTLPIGAHMKPS